MEQAGVGEGSGEGLQEGDQLAGGDVLGEEGQDELAVTDPRLAGEGLVEGDDLGEALELPVVHVGGRCGRRCGGRGS